MMKEVYLDEHNLRYQEILEPIEPLSERQVTELIINKVTDYELIRAVEAAHGIKL